LVANPSSSQFTGGDHRTVLRILRREYQVEPAWPQSPDHARQLTAAAVADGFDVVAAMGGDGVVHHVGHVLAGTETALGMIPTGTTNVYARLMRIPKKVAHAARLLAGPNQTRLAPLLSIEGDTNGSQMRRHALFAAGFGFDADVVETAEKEPYRKYRFGGLHYARTALSTALFSYRRGARSNIKVRVDGESTEALSVLVQFHPIYTYFGRMSLSLGETKENTITILAIESLPTRRVPRIAATFLRSGDLGRVPGFRLWREVDEVHLEATPAVNGQADGELTGAWTEARLTLRPQSLRVITPTD
jgi:diacylglycerol kinase family enzyme